MEQTIRRLVVLASGLALAAGSLVAARQSTPGDYRPNEICAVAGDIDLCVPPEDSTG